MKKTITGYAASINRKASFNGAKFDQKKMNGLYIEDQTERNLEDFSGALIGMAIGTPITPKHPAYGSIVSFLRDNSVSFAQSGFEVIMDCPR